MLIDGLVAIKETIYEVRAFIFRGYMSYSGWSLRF